MEELSGQKVLITGGLGFIGSNLAQSCHRHGAEVTVFDCLDPRSGGNMHNVKGILDSIILTLDDVRNFENVCKAVVGQDVIFNCAAYTSHPQSMRDPLVDIDVNCKGVINVLEAARRFNPGVRLVHVGSSTQVGRMTRERVDELHPEFPVDIYSANKSVSEKYVLIYASAYGMNASVIRLGNVYGPRSYIRSADFGFVNYFVGLALQGKDLSVFGDGSQLRSITDVDDAVTALIMAAQDPAAAGEVFFAVSDCQRTVREIAEAIVQAMGGVVKSIEWPSDRLAIEIGDVIVSNEKIGQALGWRPQWSLEDGLEATHRYYTECLNAYLN